MFFIWLGSVPIRTDALRAVIADIEALDQATCPERWQDAFGRPPAKYLSAQFMQRVLIWVVQCRLHGDVPNKTGCALKRLARGEKVATNMAKPGLHLIGEWNGRTYQVHL